MQKNTNKVNNMINTRTPIALALLSAFALAGCGGGEDEESSSNNNQNTQKTVFLSLDKSKKITEPESGILSSPILAFTDLNE